MFEQVIILVIILVAEIVFHLPLDSLVKIIWLLRNALALLRNLIAVGTIFLLNFLLKGLITSDAELDEIFKFDFENTVPKIRGVQNFDFLLFNFIIVFEIIPD